MGLQDDILELLFARIRSEVSGKATKLKQEIKSTRMAIKVCVSAALFIIYQMVRNTLEFVESARNLEYSVTPYTDTIMSMLWLMWFILV